MLNDHLFSKYLWNVVAGSGNGEVNTKGTLNGSAVEVRSTGHSSGLSSITMPCDEVHGKLQRTSPTRTTDGPNLSRSEGQSQSIGQKPRPAELLAGNKGTMKWAMEEDSLSTSSERVTS